MDDSVQQSDCRGLSRRPGLAPGPLSRAHSRRSRIKSGTALWTCSRCGSGGVHSHLNHSLVIEIPGEVEEQRGGIGEAVDAVENAAVARDQTAGILDAEVAFEG